MLYGIYWMFCVLALALSREMSPSLGLKTKQPERDEVVRNDSHKICANEPEERLRRCKSKQRKSDM